MSTMGSFCRQLGWELRKLAARPRTHLGFAACLLFEVVLVLLYRTSALDEVLGEHVWRVPPELAGTVLSGLTVATHVTAETMAIMAALFLALVAGDMIANESEERTLHMIFARPVAREAVVVQKVLACLLYTLLLALFVSATSLALGLAVEGPGPIAVVSAKESLVGFHDFATGLRRYALAMAMLGPCWTSFTLLAFALSCCKMKPGVATVVALAVLLTDEVLRIQPAFATFAPYSLTTRILTWRQAFGYDVAWLRIERNLSQLLMLDVVLVVFACWAFRRRELAP
jgi:ABC-type transport system involved in multi-copper enzyme maturation permease subunit